MTFFYRYIRDKSDVDLLEIKQEGRRSLKIGLPGTPYLRNLVAVAPKAMSFYFDQLKSEGKAIPRV